MTQNKTSESIPITEGRSRLTGGSGFMKSIAARTAFVWLLFLVLANPTLGVAKDDKTGTNPVNFTYDYRFITELQQFSVSGCVMPMSPFSISMYCAWTRQNLRFMFNVSRFMTYR